MACEDTLNLSPVDADNEPIKVNTLTWLLPLEGRKALFPVGIILGPMK